jgi:16S rRNA processing protein RimM
VPESRILMGVIGRPHGVRGWVRITSYAEDLTVYGPLSDAKGRRFVLRSRGAGVAEVAELVAGAEVKLADRAAAEKLTNTRLYVERVRLPEPEPDEFYLADLVGLAACDAAGAGFGTVTAVHDYGAGVSLEIGREGAPPLLVPFTHAAVPEVDVARGRVVVAPPEELDAANDIPRPLEEGGSGTGDRAVGHGVGHQPSRQPLLAPEGGRRSTTAADHDDLTGSRA